MDLSVIPVGVLLPVSMSACLGGGILGNYYSKKATGKRAAYLKTAVCSVVSAIFLFIASGFDISFSWYSFVLAVAFGLIVMLSSVFNVLALNIGPWAYTSMLVSMSTIITALSGYIIWGEALGVFKIIGLLFMVGCLILSVEKKEEDESKKASFKWLIYTLICVLLSACTGLTQKIHQSSSHKDERMMFLIVSFAVGFIFATMMYFVTVYQEKKTGQSVDVVQYFAKEENYKEKRKAMFLVGLLFILMGVFTGMNHMFNLYLSGEIPSVVFFPIVNGGGLVLSVLAGTFLFKEKLTKRQWIGITCGFISTALLCIPV